MNQLGIPFVKGSATSKGAAVSQLKAHLADELRVLQAIGAHGAHGATDDEIEQQLDMIHQTASARRRTLVLRGLVCDSGTTRKTRRKRHATVWVAQAFQSPLLALVARRQSAPTKAELKAFLEAVTVETWSRQEQYANVISWLRRRRGKP